MKTLFQLTINQTAVIEKENISLTLLNIVEDSRCPDGAVCVWPGQVKALFNIRINEKQETFNLTLNSNETYSQKTFEGYSVRLVEVSPYPKLNKDINIDNYAATLIINPLG
jgi:hypothetical protein